jgi:hypothetical protein
MLHLSSTRRASEVSTALLVRLRGYRLLSGQRIDERYLIFACFEEAEGVAPTSFCAIEGDVGFFDQSVGVGIARGNRDADARADA